MTREAKSYDQGLTAGDKLGIAVILGLLLTMVVSTLAFGSVEPWSIAILDLMIVLLLLLWGIKIFADGKLTFSMPATALPLIVVLVYGALQGFSFTDQNGRRWSISMDAEATRLSLEVTLCLTIAMLVAANFFEGRERIALLRNFLIFFGFGLSVFGLIQHFTWNGKYYWIFDPLMPASSPFGPFVNHNHFAGYIEMIVPIPVALIVTRAVRGEISLLYGFAAMLMSVATIISLSRGGMVSLVSGIMFVIIFGLRPSMVKEGASSSLRFPLFLSRVGAAAVLVFTIGAGIWWMGSDAVVRRIEKTDISTEERSSTPGRETIYQSRGWIWRDTLSMIRQNWVLGVGLGAFETTYPIYSRRDGYTTVSQAHNDYLQILADAGVIGALAALAFIFLVFRDSFRGQRHRDPDLSAIALGCGGGIFALLVHSLFDFNLQLPSNALLFLILTAVISSISRTVKQGRVNDAVLSRVPRLKRATRELEVWS